MKVKTSIFISVISSAAFVLFAFNAPAHWFNVRQYFAPKVIFGSAFTTLSSTDILSNFPTTYNSNITITANTSAANSFSALNEFTNASSTMFSALRAWFGATATSTFDSAGVLTLASPLAVASGGTGSTTLSSNQVLLGNGTGNIKTVSGWGTNQYALVSNGGVAAPTWQVQQTDQTANYLWTGSHGFGTSSPSVTPVSINGNLMVSGTTTVSNIKIASSSPVEIQGVKGFLPLIIFQNFGIASSNSTSATTTLSTYRIPASMLTANSKLEIDTSWSATSGSGCGFDVRFGDGTATTSMAFGGYDAVGQTNALVIGSNTKIFVVSSSQQYSSSVTTLSKGNSAYPRIVGQATSHTLTLTGVTYLDWVAQATAANNACTLNGYSITLLKN